MLVGEDIVLEATVEGHPPPHVEWYHGDKQIKSIARSQITKQKSKSKLVVSKATAEDSGLYKVLAKNKLGTNASETNVSVLREGEPPVFVRELPGDLAVKDTHPAVLEVVVRDCQKIEWILDDEPLSEDEDFEYSHDGDRRVFKIKSVNPEDYGCYQCVASNKFGQVTSTCNLTITDVIDDTPKLPKIDVIDGTSLDNLTAGNELCLSVTIAGNPTPDVKWMKDFRPLKESDNLSITTKEGQSTLKIFSLSDEDTGSYAVQAKNEEGNTQKEFKVTLSGMLLTIFFGKIWTQSVFI